jgi:hypothetical protein
MGTIFNGNLHLGAEAVLGAHREKKGKNEKNAQKAKNSSHMNLRQVVN